MWGARRREFITLLGGSVVILTAGANATEPFPTRPIRLIVPYPAGGGTDIVGRVVGQKLHESLGQPVVIDNRGGAGGTIGTAAAAKSAPDGYTLLLVPTSHVINPSIYAKLPYDTEKDFAPITMVASAAILMAVHPNVPADTVRALIEAAKARPQTIANYGSAGTGTVFHLTGELFKQLAGLQLQHVPYRGGAPTVTALLAGRFRSPSRLCWRYSLMYVLARCVRLRSRARGAAPSWPTSRPLPRPDSPHWLQTIRTPCLHPPARRHRS